MRLKTTSLLPFLLLLLSSTACIGTLQAQSAPFSSNDPATYSNYVVAEQEGVAQQFLGFSNVLLSGADQKACEARRLEVVKQIELSLRRLRNMAPFAGSTALRDEAVAVFVLYRDVHAGEFARIAAIVAHQNSTIAQMEEYFRLQVLAEKKMRDYTQRLIAAQRQFAKDNGLALLPNPAQEQFDRILDANIYNREVTLAYLSVAKANEAWWTAMEARDAAGMAKARAEIGTSAKACGLGSLPGFMNNTDFVDVARRRVTWFAALAEKEYLDVEQVVAKPTAEGVTRVNAFIDTYNQRNQEQTNAFNEASLALMRRAMGQ